MTHEVYVQLVQAILNELDERHGYAKGSHRIVCVRPRARAPYYTIRFLGFQAPVKGMVVTILEYYPFSWCSFCPRFAACNPNETNMYSRLQWNCARALLKADPTPECRTAIQATPPYRLSEIGPSLYGDEPLANLLLNAFDEVTVVYKHLYLTELDLILRAWFSAFSAQWK